LDLGDWIFILGDWMNQIPIAIGSKKLNGFLIGRCEDDWMIR
jgi:hypothetical protein